MTKSCYEDWAYLVKFFDSDEDGVLNYTDYMQWVITWDDTYLRAAVTQRDPYGVNTDEYLSPILERELAILFQKELAYHHEINSFPDIPYADAFRIIDDEQLSFIDGQSIEKFLRRCGFAPTDEELTAIIRRIDVSADALVSYAEFEEAMRPIKLKETDFETTASPRRALRKEEPRLLSPTKSHINPKLANPSKIKIENLMSGYYGLIEAYKPKEEKRNKLECKLEEEFDKYCYPGARWDSNSPISPKMPKESPVKYYHKHVPQEIFSKNSQKVYTSPVKFKPNADELPISRSYYERKYIDN